MDHTIYLREQWWIYVILAVALIALYRIIRNNLQ